MIRLSLIITCCCLFFLGNNLLAQEQEPLVCDHLLCQKLAELQIIIDGIYTRSHAPDVPGVSGGIPTTFEFQELDNKFDELKSEVNDYLSTSRYELSSSEESASWIPNKFQLIAKTHALALSILVSKIYTGQSVDELNIDRYNLVIPIPVIGELSGFRPIEKFRIYGKSNTTIIEEENENVVLKINPTLLIGAKMTSEISQDTDEAFSKLVKYPIIELYFNSILESQKLRGIESPEFPNIESLTESDYETISILSEVWENSLEAEKEKIFRDAIYDSILDIMFKIPTSDFEKWYSISNIPSDQDIINNTVADDWLDMKFANDQYLDAFNRLNISKLNSYITDSSLNCPSF